jgi:RNA polymerase sigma factor (sigma-70 family)
VKKLSDQQLLGEYARSGSEAAFAELVRRHVDCVYSAAFRMVGEAALAEDVTQGAFVALAQNARRLMERPVLSGWLHRTARNLAANAIRSEVRRRARQEAAAMNELPSDESDSAWAQIAPHLDAALEDLSEADRDAVSLRYFEQKSAREMAAILGTSEEAAQKRVNRAVERLRRFFARQGITVGAGGLAAVLSVNAVRAAPAGLAAGISAAALASAAGGTGMTAGLSTFISMTKLQAAIIGGIVVSAVIAPLTLRHELRLHRENEALRRQLAQGEADKQSLSNQVFQASIALHPAPPAPGAPAPSTTKAPDALTPYQRVAEFLDGHQHLPKKDIEAYLRRNRRDVESLMAAFQVSLDPAYLREAATNAPDDPAVQFAVIANRVFPDQERKWIDAFKASSPQNALAWYFSAWDYFQSNQPDKAIRELEQGARLQFYGDYAAQSAQAIEEMYRQAGWPALAAEARAPGTAAASTGYLSILKDLGNQAVQTQQQSLNQADASSASSMASVGLVLAGQLRRASGPIDELVGIAIEKKLLGQLDPAVNYDFLGGSVSQAQADLDHQKQSIREALETRDKVRPTLSEAELGDYWEREKLYGEMYALQWLGAKYPQNQPTSN